MVRGERESGQTLCLEKLMVNLATAASSQGLFCVKGKNPPVSDVLLSVREFVSRKCLRAVVTSPELYLPVKRALSIN